jgi:hypothetical protein
VDCLFEPRDPTSRRWDDRMDAWVGPFCFAEIKFFGKKT